MRSSLAAGVLLETVAKRGRIRADVLDQTGVRGTVDQQDARVLDRVEEVLRRRAIAQAGRVGQPPRLRRELDDVFLALGVDDVVAQAAARDEGRVAGDVARALEVLAGGEPAEHKSAADLVDVRFAEHRALLEVGAQHEERRRGVRRWNRWTWRSGTITAQTSTGVES
jgi:hypothetical protein